MKANVHTIHHYEDEPELLRWIPGVLFNRFWSRFPQWVQDEGAYEEHDETRTTFALEQDATKHVIEYRLYKRLDDFNRQFAENAKVADVALIDVMDKGNRPNGLAVYRDVVKKLRPQNVYLLTSFPSTVTISVPEGHILAKPVDATTLADLLIECLGIGPA